MDRYTIKSGEGTTECILRVTFDSQSATLTIVVP